MVAHALLSRGSNDATKGGAGRREDERNRDEGIGFGDEAVREKCRIIRRHGVIRVICTNPRHKQRQG